MDFDVPTLFLATSRAKECRGFYEDVLRLKFVSDDPFALVFSVGGLKLRIQKVDRFTAAGHTVLGWSVGDIHSAVLQLKSRGAIFERYDALAQDELGIWDSPTGARVAWFNDPDQNILSLTQYAEKS